MLARVVNWNVGWARPDSARGHEISRRISVHDPEVVCLTEGHSDYFSQQGNLICSGADYGYRAPLTRRKVLLWSKCPWSPVDAVGHDSLPPGRFVAGTTETTAGTLQFVGVCIPWKDAHVRTGRKDRAAWEDHLSFLKGLAAYLRATSTEKLVLLGDFNQTAPRTRAPKAAWNGLAEVLGTGLTLVTAGLVHSGRPTIDHVALGTRLRSGAVSTVSAEIVDGNLSDHFGVFVEIARGPR